MMGLGVAVAIVVAIVALNRGPLDTDAQDGTPLAVAVADLQTRVAALESLLGIAPGTPPVPPAISGSTPSAAAALVVAPVGTGTRDNPIPIGAVAEVGGGWSVRVISAISDADEIVAGANRFNGTPQAGRQFVIVRVAATFGGAEDAESSTASYLSFKAVGRSAVAYATYDPSCGSVPDPLPSSEVFVGGAIEGNLCFQIKPEDVPSLVVFIENILSFAGQDRKYFAVR